jgi:hypothetical protein
MQIWAYKKQREIARRLSTYRGELALGHPKFPEGSQAGLADGNFGGDNRLDLPPIQYGKEDDKAIEQWIRENLNTTWHSSKHKNTSLSQFLSSTRFLSLTFHHQCPHVPWLSRRTAASSTKI